MYRVPSLVIAPPHERAAHAIHYIRIDFLRLVVDRPPLGDDFTGGRRRLRDSQWGPPVVACLLEVLAGGSLLDEARERETRRVTHRCATPRSNAVALALRCCWRDQTRRRGRRPARRSTCRPAGGVVRHL